jgi:long-chain acyl-CoA synthetase
MREGLERSLLTQLEQVNARLDPHERVQFIAVVDGPWTIANGMMTPTLKLRRGSLEQRYMELVDEWKRQGRQIVWEVPEQKTRQAGGAEAG